MKKLHLILLLIVCGFLIWSGINPYSRFTWYLEIAPAVIGIVILIIIYPKYKFTDLTYVLIAIQAIILIVGGKYTYAKMPLFDYISEIFGFTRNYYDRLGHFIQGFVPAMITREILIRKNIVVKKNWINIITVNICLSISAFYELIEFLVAKLTGTAAEAFLGTQGDVWDTQWDMTFALFGAIIALILLSRLQDKYIKNTPIS